MPHNTALQAIVAPLRRLNYALYPANIHSDSVKHFGRKSLDLIKR